MCRVLIGFLAVIWLPVWEANSEQISELTRSEFVSPTEINIFPTQSCQWGGKDVDLTWIERISESVIEIDNAGQASYLKIANGKLVESTSPKFTDSVELPVSSAVQEILSAETIRPLELNFAYLNRQRAVYWREPQGVIPARHGLISLEPDNFMEVICLGEDYVASLGHNRVP